MIDQFWPFLLAITLLTVSPGVDSLLVIRNASRGGWQDGLTTSTGICCGLFAHAAVSALGISALLLQSAVAFNLLKLLGGGYLLWLGILNLRGALRRGGAPRLQTDGMARHPFVLQRSLREGFVCNLFNPKTLLFYMAFLPQFIDPTRSPLVQALFMAMIHFLIAMIYQGGLALLVSHMRTWFSGGWLRRASDGLLGLLLGGFGLKILLTRQL